MENLFIDGDDSFPTVSFDLDGRCKIEGRLIPEDVAKAFAPLLVWAEMTTTKSLTLDINLYYFNTAASKRLYDLFTAFEANESIKNIAIRWHFEEGDDEMMEAGEMYEDMLDRTIFEYIEYAEVV